MSKIGNLVIGVGLNLKGLSKDLNRASYKLNRQGAKWKNAGRTMAASFTLPFAAVGVAGVKMALDIETSLNKIQNLVGASSEQVAQYSKDLKKVSNDTGKSQAELADGLFQIESAGIKGKAAVDTLTVAAKASAIGLGETKVVADALTSVMNAYGSENISAAEATDQLAAAVKFGKLEAASLAPAIGQVIPIAAKLGVSFSQVGAAIAVYSKQGADASKASIGVKGILSNFLGDGAKEQVEALDKLGTSMEEVRESFKTKGLAQTLNELSNAADANGVSLSNVITNTRALTAAYAITKDQEDYIKVSEGIADSAGLVADGMKNVEKSAGFKLNKAINQLKNVAITIGELLIPTVMKLTGFLTSLVNKFNGLSDTTKKMAVSFALIVAAIGPVLFIIGQLVISVGAIISATGLAAASVSSFLLVFSGIGAAVVAVTTLGFAIKSLFDKSKDLSESQKAINEIREKTTKAVDEETESNRRLIGVMKDSASSTDLKKEAYERLLARYPELLQKYTDEDTALTDLTRLEGELASATEDRVRRQLAAQAIADIKAKRKEAQDVLDKAKLEGVDARQRTQGKYIGERTKAEDDVPRQTSEDSAAANVRLRNAKRFIKFKQEYIDKLDKEIEKIQGFNGIQTDRQKEDEEYSKSKITLVGVLTEKQIADAKLIEENSKKIREKTKSEQEKAAREKKAADEKAAREAVILAKQKADNIEEIRKAQINTIQEEQEEEKRVLKKYYDDLIASENAGFQDKIDLSNSYHELREEMEKKHQKALADIAEGGYIAPSFIDFNAGTDSSIDSIIAESDKLAAQAEEIKSALSQGLTDMVGGISDTIGASLEDFTNFGDLTKNIGLGILKTMGDVMQKLGKIIIAGAIALKGLQDTIKNFLSGGNPLVALAGGIALLAIGKAISSRVSNVGGSGGGSGKGLPKLAKGGVLTGETMFIGGEYAGAANNPEIVTPQNIMAETFRKVLGQSGTGGSGVGVLHMDTIRFGLEKDQLRVT
jgi:TP901 family phage tail tape measure protein